MRFSRFATWMQRGFSLIKVELFNASVCRLYLVFKLVFAHFACGLKLLRSRAQALIIHVLLCERDLSDIRESIRFQRVVFVLYYSVIGCCS